VDEVAAEHVGADLVVHYGPAALTCPPRLPVLFVFGRAPLDADVCVARLRPLLPADRPPPPLLLLDGDLAYLHGLGTAEERSARHTPPGWSPTWHNGVRVGG
jgi:diphthamide biosynthesis enzyme Dph1/Dph2-like protein